MPILDSPLKALVLSALAGACGLAFAQSGDQWYGGQSAGFWGLGNSVGVRGSLPGMFSSAGMNPDSMSPIRQYGGYRISNAFAIEGVQTQFSPSVSSCNSDPSACYGSAWSLSGVATLPFESGLSLYGRLGLHYLQRGSQDDAAYRHSLDEPGGIGKVYGVGLSYGLTKMITVHAESERYSELMNNNATGPSAGFGLESSVHSIGLSIKF